MSESKRMRRAETVKFRDVLLGHVWTRVDMRSQITSSSRNGVKGQAHGG